MSISLEILNNFNPSRRDHTDYFGANHGDESVWLYFLNSSGKITYTDASTQASKTVQDAIAVPLSAVENGTFSLQPQETSTKVYAGLGAKSPFSGTNGPGIFDENVPCALIEWTIQGGPFDNIDVTYIDTFSFPTTLTVLDGSGARVGRASFKPNTRASDVLAALGRVMPTKPTGPDLPGPPQPGTLGYGPLVATVPGSAPAKRWIGSSKYYMTYPPVNDLRGLYLYAPSLQGYLGYLRANEPTTRTNAGAIKGWYIDYDGDGGYSGYVSITGDAIKGYGIEVHDIRVNTAQNAVNDWQADPNAGSAARGTITIVANGSTAPYTAGTTTPDGSNVTGPWTDAVIYSGAAIMGKNGVIGEGPIVTGSDDFAPGGTHSVLAATILASISASMATGLLGSLA